MESIIVALIGGGVTLIGVREHNNFARRVPVMEEQIKVINHRIADLETAGKD